MMKRIAWILSVLFASFLLPPATAEQLIKPKLVLQIVVDQLRGDMPATVLDRLDPGGFRYLYELGIVYQNAHHRHANTETVVGHATLATGADPTDHGTIGNIWFDKELNRVV